MGRRHKLINSVIHIIDHNRDGAYRTRHDRQEFFLAMANQLYASGYQLDHIRYLKAKHIWHLVRKWQVDNISTGTIKNRLSHLRWLASKLNKANIVPSNERLKIGNRCYVGNADKSRQLTDKKLSGIGNTRMQLSLRAQQLFGLRVEESLKIQPSVADRGDQLYIKGSWAKGGRDRHIPVYREAQRQWLSEAKALVKFKSASLIPKAIPYKTWRSRFMKCCQRSGIYHLHGHRHFYAHQRFKTLAGYDCPVRGGPIPSDLSATEKIRDRAVRLAISKELGHGRHYVTKIYCG